MADQIFGTHFPRCYFDHNAQNTSIFEIGCGAGFDAERFVSMGFTYTGIDLSTAAVELTKKRLKKWRLFDPNVLHADFFEMSITERYSSVFDRGVFHGIKDPVRRLKFVELVASITDQGGSWVSVIGSSDEISQSESRGAMMLSNVVQDVEPIFAIEAINKAPYGPENWPENFSAWHCKFVVR